MSSESLASAYVYKAMTRLKILEVLIELEDYSDVVREAQEIVELALKGMLRGIGVEPPKYHDVGPLIVEHGQHFQTEIRPALEELASISKWLRKEREFSFYGDVDFNPLAEYSRDDAEEAQRDAHRVVDIATRVVKPAEPGKPAATP